MLSRIKTRHFVGFGVLVVLMSFQNCSPSLEDYQAELQQEEDSLPLAFDATVDTIAYMSCSGMPLSALDTTGYFSFRAGAFNGGAGLTLDPTFYQSIAGGDPASIALEFSQSSTTAGAYAQLALRQKGQYQNVLTGSGTVTPYDISNFLMELDQNPIASQLAALTPGTWQNNFEGPSSDYANGSGQMSQSIVFMDSETTALSIRNDLNSQQAVMSVTFTTDGSSGNSAARSPQGNVLQNAVYGVGYQINFQQPYSWTYSDARVLGNIYEYDLGGGTLQQPHSWTCSPNMQMMIVQPSDLFGVAGGANFPCVEHTDYLPTDVTSGTITQSQWQIYQTLRNVLPDWEWYIDLGTAAQPHNCIVPKGNAALMSCYGEMPASTLNNGMIAYGGFSGYSGVSYSCQPFTPSVSNGGTPGDCPHWVSVCTRN